MRADHPQSRPPRGRVAALCPASRPLSSPRLLAAGTENIAVTMNNQIHCEINLRLQYVLCLMCCTRPTTGIFFTRRSCCPPRPPPSAAGDAVRHGRLHPPRQERLRPSAAAVALRLYPPRPRPPPSHSGAAVRHGRLHLPQPPCHGCLRPPWEPPPATAASTRRGRRMAQLATSGATSDHLWPQDQRSRRDHLQQRGQPHGRLLQREHLRPHGQRLRRDHLRPRGWRLRRDHLRSCGPPTRSVRAHAPGPSRRSRYAATCRSGTRSRRATARATTSTAAPASRQGGRSRGPMIRLGVGAMEWPRGAALGHGRAGGLERGFVTADEREAFLATFVLAQ